MSSMWRESSSLVTYGLSFQWSKGHHHCHAAANDTIHSVLAAAKVPFRLEPSGLYCFDGKCAAGITVVPWINGKLAVWDATCSDTLAPSHTLIATREAAAVATLAEERKVDKYASLSTTHAFIPVAIVTSGVFGPQTMVFQKDLGHYLAQVTGDENTTKYLLQRLSVAVQQGILLQCWAPRAICLAQRHLSLFNCMHVHILHAPVVIFTFAT